MVKNTEEIIFTSSRLLRRNCFKKIIKGWKYKFSFFSFKIEINLGLLSIKSLK